MPLTNENKCLFRAKSLATKLARSQSIDFYNSVFWRYSFHIGFCGRRKTHLRLFLKIFNCFLLFTLQSYFSRLLYVSRWESETSKQLKWESNNNYFITSLWRNSLAIALHHVCQTFVALHSILIISCLFARSMNMMYCYSETTQQHFTNINIASCNM